MFLLSYFLYFVIYYTLNNLNLSFFRSVRDDGVFKNKNKDNEFWIIIP